MHQNDVTPSNAMTDIILQGQLMSASACFPRAFKVVTLLFHITQFFSIGYISEVCLNKVFTCSIFLSIYPTKKKHTTTIFPTKISF